MRRPKQRVLFPGDPREPRGGNRHGLTPQQQDAILREQGYVCRICRRADPGPGGWHIDHDHELAAGHNHPADRGCPYCVRGFLCSACNAMLGFARDNPATLAAAIGYLRTRGRLGA